MTSERTRLTHHLAWLILLLSLPAISHGFYGHEVETGTMRVVIEEMPEVSAYDAPVSVTLVLTNKTTRTLSGEAAIRDLVDETRVEGPSPHAFRIAPASEARLEFAIAFGPGALSALYPVHAYVTLDQRDDTEEIHAVQIVQTRFTTSEASSETPSALRPISVPDGGATLLLTTDAHRIAWQYYDGPLHYRPTGWVGTDEVSYATAIQHAITAGESRPAFRMHPPYRPGSGSVYIDYLLELPQTERIRFSFANAVNAATDPQGVGSDGVTFRVWAAPVETPDAEPTEFDLLHERFTNAKEWEAAEADLAAYAGQTVLLRLESHPGPDRNVTCDSCYWSGLTVAAGPPPAPRAFSFAEAIEKNEALGRAILKGEKQPDNRYTFLLGTGDTRTAAVLMPTQRGILDGVLTLVGPTSTVSFDGLHADILDQPVLRGDTPVVSREYRVKGMRGGAKHIHGLALDGEHLDLTVTIRSDGDGLRFAIDSPKHISDFALGPADREAPVVYFGHGHRVVQPEAFREWYCGHLQSTSHVGFDFEGGLSLVQALDLPPGDLEVDPERKRYAFHARGNSTLTLVPGEAGAIDCAIRYRPLLERKAAGGVENLAGRFAFDDWSANYSGIRDGIEKMVRYGLTDATLNIHNWQRWEYDYRLPDIWPPNPKYGTIEDLQAIGDLCRENDILWGLHDNYTDFYPDAGGFTFDDVFFTEAGTPVHGWLNEWRDAQAYAWRPDRFMPYLKRNMRLVRKNLRPTFAYIDVLSALGPFDFHDREGNFHPATETREAWGRAFEWTRDHLGGNAPTTSESGHDQLIGWLDGGDCNFHRLSNERIRHTQYMPCAEWDRVPWADLVNHDKFILRGVGYSDRYAGARRPYDHGIYSDDYISAEVLLGHALMVGTRDWGRQIVRKYWLAQGVARNLALRNVEGHKMLPRDTQGEPFSTVEAGHRQTVTWDNGTRVMVNRGETDWSVEGRVLPQFGYLVQGDGIESALEKRGGVFCESSISADGWYCNARATDLDYPRRVVPRIENFQDQNGARIAWDVVWDAQDPVPRDFLVFVHFYAKDTQHWLYKIAFQDDHVEPTSSWRGEVRYPRDIEVPADVAEGQYEVGFGLHDGRSRLSLATSPVPGNVGHSASWVGTLDVQGAAGEGREIAFTPAPRTEYRVSRVNLERKSVDFGFAVTNGAFRVQRTASGLRCIALPDEEPFDVTLRLDALDAEGRRVAKVVAHDAAGGEKHTIPARIGQNTVSFRHPGGKEFQVLDIELR